MAGGSGVKVGKPRGAGGQVERHRRQATHTCGPGCQELPIQSPGAPWVGVGGRKRRGEVTGNVHTKRRAAWGGSWLGTKPCRALTCWTMAASQASPPELGGKTLSTTHRHSREDGVSSGGAGALPWHTLKRQEPLSEGGQETDIWEAVWALGMKKPGFKSRICL